jgi:hypothetical protein
MGSYLLSTTLVLVGVCALAVLALKLLKRGPQTSGAGLKLLASLPLDGRRALYVVEAGGRCFLVGGGESGLALVAELDAAQVKAGVPAPARGLFAEALARVVGRA